MVMIFIVLEQTNIWKLIIHILQEQVEILLGQFPPPLDYC